MYMHYECVGTIPTQRVYRLSDTAIDMLNGSVSSSHFENGLSESW